MRLLGILSFSSVAPDDQIELLQKILAVTMNSFLVPRLRKMTFDELVQQFLMRLRFALLAAQPPIDWQPGAVRAVRGGNASLIGTMNNMVYLLSAPKSPQLQLNDEQILNDTPFFAIPEVFPSKAFFNRLNQRHP